jgi:hypothetical protein
MRSNVCMTGRSRGSESVHADGERHRDLRPREHAVEDRTPEARLAAVGLQPVQERDAPLLDAVAELGQQRRQDRDRADHGHRHHHDRAGGKRRERLAAGEVHARHRDHDREAGDEHRPAGRGRGGLQRRIGAASGRALLALATQVEAVVDADRQADEQDDRRDRLVDRQRLAQQRDEPDRGADRRQREQQRQPGRDERAERDHEDEQRDRQRQRLGLLEVLLEDLAERLAGAGVAELLDAQAGMVGGDRGDGLQRRVDAIVDDVEVAGELEAHERRAVVARDLAGVAGRERTLDVLDVRRARQPALDLGHGGAERRIGGRARCRLDEHGLLRMTREMIEDRLVGAARLAWPVLLPDERVQAGGAAADDRDRDERQPAEDRDLAMGGAPAPGPRRKVSRCHVMGS